MFIIDLIKFIILGIVQGFTEPIPVSSSGHLLIFQSLLKGLEDIDFGILSTVTNCGSLIAIVFLFRKKIFSLIKDFFNFIKTKEVKYYNNYKYCWLIVLATIPAGIMGLIVTKLGIFDFLEDNVKFVGVTLLITGFFLFLIRNFKGNIDSDKITFKDALVIGLFQMVALIPGISRSGATIVGGMYRGLRRHSAFDFSFMLYIPISIATTILCIKDLIESNISNTMYLLYFISMVFAGIVTYFATKWFRDLVKDGKLIYFVWYCLFAGLLVIIFL